MPRPVHRDNADPHSAGRGQEHHVRETLLGIGILALLGLIVLIPLPVLVRTHVAGYGDVWQHLWNMWWFRQSVLIGVDPYVSPFMYVPVGADLSFHSYSPLNMVFGFFLQMWFPLTVSYNIVIGLSLFLSTLTAFLLGRTLTGRFEGGLFCGALWCFSSVHLSRIMFLHLFSCEMMPLVVWFLYIYYRDRRFRSLVGAAASLALCGMCSWYQLLFMIMFATVFLIVFPLWRPVRSLLVIGSLTALLMGPFLFHPIRHILSGEQYMQSPSGMAKTFSAELLSFFIPPEQNPVWGDLFDGYYEKSAMQHTERTNYLGWSGMILCLTMLLMPSRLIIKKIAPIGVSNTALTSGPSSERECNAVTRLKILCLIVLVCSMLLALGPSPQILGSSWDSVKLPFAWLQNTPIFSILRAPNRFLFLAQLALSITGAFGGIMLLEAGRKRVSPQRRWLRLAGLLGIILLDYRVFPALPLSDSSLVPPRYEQMATHAPRGMVLDIPLPQQDFPKPLYYQTIHGLPMFGGYISRTPRDADAFIDSQPFLDFARSARLSITDQEARSAGDLLKAFPIAYIIVHDHVLPGQSRIMLHGWLDGWCPKPVATALGTTVYATGALESIPDLAGSRNLVPPLQLPVWLFRRQELGQMVVHRHDDRFVREWVLWENGLVAQEFLVNDPACFTISVTSHGTPVAGVYPHVVLSVDTLVIGSFFATAHLSTSQAYPVFLNSGSHLLSISYDNDAFEPPDDRNLFLWRVSIEPKADGENDAGDCP